MPTLTRINLDRVVARLNSFVVFPPPTMSTTTRFALCTSSSLFVCFVVVFSRRQRAMNSSSHKHSSLTSFLSLFSSLSRNNTRQTESVECCYDAINFLLCFPLFGEKERFCFFFCYRNPKISIFFVILSIFIALHTQDFKTLFVARRRRIRRTTRRRRPR
jgi:hypothetical protein